MSEPNKDNALISIDEFPKNLVFSQSKTIEQKISPLGFGIVSKTYECVFIVKNLTDNFVINKVSGKKGFIFKSEPSTFVIEPKGEKKVTLFTEIDFFPKYGELKFKFVSFVIKEEERDENPKETFDKHYKNKEKSYFLERFAIFEGENNEDIDETITKNESLADSMYLSSLSQTKQEGSFTVVKDDIEKKNMLEKVKKENDNLKKHFETVENIYKDLNKQLENEKKEFAEIKKQKEPEPSLIKTNVNIPSSKNTKSKRPITTTHLGILCGIAFIFGIILA
jgi:hypothetical protein